MKWYNGVYLFLNVLLCVAGAFDNLPEFNELLVLNLPVGVEIDCIEKLIGRDLAKAYFGPVLLSFIAVDGFVAVFVEDLEDLVDSGH